MERNREKKGKEVMNFDSDNSDENKDEEEDDEFETVKAAKPRGFKKQSSESYQ